MQLVEVSFLPTREFLLLPNSKAPHMLQTIPEDHRGIWGLNLPVAGAAGSESLPGCQATQLGARHKCLQQGIRGQRGKCGQAWAGSVKRHHALQEWRDSVLADPLIQPFVNCGHTSCQLGSC